MNTDRPRVSPYIPLFFGICAISTGAFFARLADAPSLAIAAYRAGLASLILLPFALATRHKEMAALSRSDLYRVIGAGFFLALHFATWISSLAFTTVASSVVLVNTIPLWVGLLSPFVTGERLSTLTKIGIAASVAGGAVVGWGDFALGGKALLGDFLALCGALSAAGYFLFGRIVRPKLSLLSYVFLCYGTAAIFLALVVLVSGTPVTGFSSTTWWMFLAMAIIPQILGHSSYNWALRWLSAGFVAVALLGEPIGSTILAYLLLGEKITVIRLAGMALIGCGIVLAAKGER